MSVAATPGDAQRPIKLGDINSYSRFATFAVPYRNAMQLAIDEIDSTGHVRGRKREVVWRDDNVFPSDATRTVDELVKCEKVDILDWSRR